jgi:hypothetical protein
MRYAGTILLALLAGCNKGGGDSDTNDTNDTDGGGGDSIDTNPDAGTLADEFDLADEGTCESFDGYTHEGATRFYVGAFNVSGEDVTGYEAAVLFPNTSLQETVPEFTQCEVWFSATGIKEDPVACGSCDYSLNLHFTLDRTKTSCIDDYVNSSFDTAYDVVYDVAIDGSGNSTFYFDSGTELGSGIGNDNGATYASDKSCEIY